MAGAGSQPADVRLGIDLGGTKIAAVVLGEGGSVLADTRIASPQGDYDATIRAIGGVVAALEGQLGMTGGRRCSVGIGMPGSLSPATGRVQGANSTWLNDRPFGRDLELHLGRQVRLANDANCFALSEAVDGAGAGARSVLGVILGTGCGGGLVIDGRLIDGPNAISGEWGHNPLPWARADELPGPVCWCGRMGCMETWVSGPGLAADHLRHGGEAWTAAEIAGRAAAGDPAAQASLERHADRLARGLAHVINIVDPAVIVLGGGLSSLAGLYDAVPRLAAPHVFAAAPVVTIRPPRWGDASGVRGAAWLW